MPINFIQARQIFDSRGNPTVEVEIKTDKGTFHASTPSGTSIGAYEAVDLRDNSDAYHGKGVAKAVQNVNQRIAGALVGKDLDVTNQAAIDRVLLDLDGTPNKAALGANAILAVSMAVCKAGAAQKGCELYRHIADLAGNTNIVQPVPAFNVLNGGSHAGNRLAMQEFMILPTGASSFTEAMKMGTEVYHHLKSVIKAKYGQDACNVGDQGGYAPNIHNSKDALDLLKQSIKKAGYTGKVQIAIDAAASVFFKKGKYDLDYKNPKTKPGDWLSAGQLADKYLGYIREYAVVSVEDAFDQDDWDAWPKLTNKVNIQVTGDSLLSTNPSRVRDAIEKKACNALLLSVNQIGTVTEAIEACKMSQDAGWGVMVSHRSGETEDTFIADLAVGLSSGQIKAGAPCNGHLAKYNRLLYIEDDQGSKGKYAGVNFRNPQEAKAPPK